jgi:hypothetical protein
VHNSGTIKNEHSLYKKTGMVLFALSATFKLFCMKATSVKKQNDTTNQDSTANLDTNVSLQEKELLRRSSESMSTEEDEDLRRAALDNTDEDGTLLNEATNLSGDELDVPGSEDDDDNEEIGEEDEENNIYSLPDQDEK